MTGLLYNKIMQNINFIVGENKERKVTFEWNLCWDNHIQELDFHRIYYITKGHGILYLNNGTTFDILPGYLYLIPAFSVNNTKTLEEMYQFYIHFQFESVLLNTQLELSPCLMQPVEINNENQVICLFQNVFQNSKKEDVSSSLRATGALALLLSLIIKDSMLSDSSLLPFKDILTYFNNHISEPIDLTDLSQRMGYNKKYFSNKFKKTFGLSPQTFFIKKRLYHSLKLLNETDKTIEEIALSCGFCSCSYFIKRFHKEFNNTPYQYKQKNHKFTHS